jgi:hypothetical protein
VLQYLLSRDIIPHNNIIKLYAPCPECYNGENHSCNYRNVTTEYISLKRYGVRLDSLKTLNKDTAPVHISYYEFDGPANDQEVYVEPGIDLVASSDRTYIATTNANEDSDNEYYEKQHIYKIPPKKILKNKHFDV